MRAHLLLLVIAAAAAPQVARADGEVAVRGVYYKEHSTRVEQPMVDARFDAGPDATVDAHLLVDAITSASPGSGADAKPFTERRYELGLGYLRTIDVGRVGALVRGSYEPDYLSGFLGARFEHDFADKNFTLALSAGAGRDRVSNAGAQGPFVTKIEERLSSTLVSVSATQVLSPNTIGSVTYDLGRLSGYLENPYRSVITADGLVPERVPDTRTRHALAAVVRRYLPGTETTVIGAYRFYLDDWGVLAHTPEVRVIQQAGPDLEVGMGFRYYWQTAADFFQPTYPTSDPQMEPFLTDDPKLARFHGETISAKFAVLGDAFGLEGAWSRARAEVIIEYVVQTSRFGNAGIAHVALTVPFDY
jgi:Protein of unknown function (DUF3570)